MDFRLTPAQQQLQEGGDLDRGRLEIAWGLFAEVPQLVATSHRPEAWEALGGTVGGRLEAGRLAAAPGA